MSKELFKQIRILMVIAAALVLAVIYSDVFFKGVLTCVNIVKPFVYGGAVAFVLNIPMRKIESSLFSKASSPRLKAMKRPVSLLLTIILMLAVIALVVGLIVPNLADTFGMIVNEVPTFLERLSHTLSGLNLPGFDKQAGMLENVSENWETIMNKVVSFLQTGLSSILGSTVQIVSSVVSKIVNGVIAFIFAIYILTQKETLSANFSKLLKAYVKPAERKKLLRIIGMLDKNFTSFITGQ